MLDVSGTPFDLMARQPGFTALALLTIAVGIAANTAIFSMVYGVLLRPLPYPTTRRCE
jgi:putative ABC transport system permease protein